MSGSLKDKSLSAMMWVLADKAGTGGINFLVTLVLARLLLPADFGLVAMVMIFFEFAGAFVESGFSVALIRQKEITEADKSTTFIFNLVTAVVLYALLFAAAPAIADFFNQSELTDIVRVMALTLIISGFGIIQRSVLTQQIDFRTLTRTRLISVVLSGAVAVGLALNGYGVWALVAKFLLATALDTAFLWIINRWTPSLQFSGESFRRLFGFGSNILLSALLDRFYQNVYKLIIGKLFAATTLGFYTQASNFLTMTISTLFQTLRRVTYPVLSKLQDDLDRLKEGYRTFIKMSSFVVIPALVGLAVLAEPIIVTLIGEKWLPSVPFLQLLCLSGLTHHFSVINLNMLLVLGHSNLSLRLEVIKKVNITIAIAVGLQWGLWGLVIGEVIATWVNMVFNTYYSDRLLRYSLVEQVRDVLPTLLFSAVMGGVLYGLHHYLDITGLLSLVLAISAGGIIYLGLHLLARTQEMEMVRELIIPRTLKMMGVRAGAGEGVSG